MADRSRTVTARERPRERVPEVRHRARPAPAPPPGGVDLLAVQRAAGNRTAVAVALAGADRPQVSRRPAATGGPVIQRHASDEHLFLGNLTPQQISAMATGKDVAAKKGLGTASAKLRSFTSFFSKSDTGPSPAERQQLDAARQVVVEQMRALDNWRRTGGPNPANVNVGSTAYDHNWGGQLVVLDVKDGEKVVATVGDINALPDFYGSLADATSVSKSVLQATLQVIRREAYMSLENLRMQISGEFDFGMDKRMEFAKSSVGKGDWKGAEGVTAETWGGSGPEALANIQATERLTRGESTGGSGRGEDTSYKSTLARNACHFPPESWLRWKEHHEQARALIDGAASLVGFDQIVNRAVTLNAFGEHYLQDSYAGGHLINKGFVMALALDYTSDATNKNRGMGPEQIKAIQDATGHRDAYEAPALAAEAEQGGLFAMFPQAQLDALAARDPQSALEAAKTAQGDQGAAEVRAAGIDPSVVSIEQYRTFLNDTWYQKLTNALHDKFCIGGLEVSSPDHPALFRIYGDYNMLRSAEGASYAAATSQMSRGAINALAANKRDQLIAQARQAAAQQGQAGPQLPVPPPRPVPTVTAIMARLPNTVKDDDGQTYDLGEWATGGPMRRLVKEQVEAISLNQVVRGASALTGFASGMKVPEHQPF